jgi:hypothetical protein
VKFYLMLALTLLLVACGGGDNQGNAHNDDDHGHDHGHGDVHGEVHPLGEKDLGDGYVVKAAHAEVEGAKESVFEIEVLKDGKPLKEAKVTVWFGDKVGSHLVAPQPGKWTADENLFDCHVKMPSGVENPMVWVRVKHGDKDQSAGFDMPKDDH